MTHKLGFLILIFCFLTSLSLAQFDQLVSPRQAPQARSQQELDSYIDILYARTPLERAERIKVFIGNYPESQLRGIVYQQLMLAYQEMGEYEGLIESGERALTFQPDNLNTILTLASAIPNGVSGDTGKDRLRLAEAEKYARSVFEAIQRLKLPRSVSPERWQTLRLEMEAAAHEALGYIATKRGLLPEAIASFEKAVEQNPNPQGSQVYRLGVAYMLAGRERAAREMLLRAAELGPQEIGRMAHAALDRMKREKSQ